MRILCISPFFPTIRDSESFCGGKMVLALRERGADVTVLAMTADYLAGKQDDSPMWRALRPYSVPIGPGQGRQRLRAALCALRYQISIWPRWVDQVVNTAAQLHDAAPFDLVYSRSLPMFGHVAGFWAAKALRTPWIANINDPWDEHLFPGVRTSSGSGFYRRLSEHWLRRTLALASAVTFPSTRLAKFTAGLAQSEREGEVIAHMGWPGLQIGAGAGSGANGQFTLLHAGKLGCNEVTGRSTGALLGGLKRFLENEPGARTQTRLVLVGPEDVQSAAIIRQLELSDTVFNIGQVNYEASLQQIGGASVCVLIEAVMKEGVYLPSKLADYIVAGKPVLALSPGTGTVADMAGERGLLRVGQSDEVEIAATLGQLFQAHRGGALGEFAPSERLLARFEPGAVSAQFLELAGRVTHLDRARPGRVTAKRSNELETAALLVRE